jgi:hypothetical protein
MNSAMESSKYLNRNCPICGSAAPSKPEVFSAIAGEGLSFEQLRSYWINFYKDQKVFFSYVRCTTCKLLYAPVFFTPDQLEELYMLMPPNMEVVPRQVLERTQRGYFETMRHATLLEGGFIEVGPDTGLFTQNCVREGRFSEYWLFEPNQSVEAALNDTMKGTNFHIIRDMFGFSNVPDNAASVVVMIHVMDHLLDPVNTLRSLRQKLTAGGHVLLVTHDESSLLRRLIGSRWPAFCLQHPQLYNLATMAALFEAAGYEVIKQSKTVNYFPISFLLKQLLWALGFKIESVPSFGQIAVGLKLGNLLTIATPKKES